MGCGGVDWIDLAQYGQVAGTCECDKEHEGFHKVRGSS